MLICLTAILTKSVELLNFSLGKTKFIVLDSKAKVFKSCRICVTALVYLKSYIFIESEDDTTTEP